MKLDLVSIFVDDPVRAHEFYTEVLGFLSKEFTPDAHLAIVVSPEDPGGTALLLEPRGDSFARMESRGVQFRDDLAKPEWSLENMFEDTFGNLILLQEQSVA
jgi:catechol 2,3-dioxygenase-like lactoylglutathione lyase family enzyme